MQKWNCVHVLLPRIEIVNKFPYFRDQFQKVSEVDIVNYFVLFKKKKRFRFINSKFKWKKIFTAIDEQAIKCLQLCPIKRCQCTKSTICTNILWCNYFSVVICQFGSCFQKLHKHHCIWVKYHTCRNWPFNLTMFKHEGNITIKDYKRLAGNKSSKKLRFNTFHLLCCEQISWDQSYLRNFHMNPINFFHALSINTLCIIKVLSLIKI